MRSAPSSAAERLLPPAATVVPLALALGILVLFPLFDMVRTAVADRGGWSLDATALRNSLLTSTAAASLAAVAGTAVALVLRRGPRPSPGLRVALLLPLLIPPFVSALSWGRAFGPGGLSDDVTGWTLPGLYGPIGIIVVLAVHSTPLVYLVVSAALAARARPEFEWAARACGATPVTVVRRIVVPALLPAIAGGALLAFVVSLNSFGVPALLGTPAGFPTMTTRIFADLARSSDPAALGRVLGAATTLMALVGIAAGLAGWLLRSASPSPAAREPFPEAAESRGRRIVWAVLTLTTLLPLIALLLTALTRAVGLDPVPANWTLQNFDEVWQGATAAAAGRSLLLAATAATGCVLLTLLLVVGRRPTARRWEATVAATFAVPGSVLAVAFLAAYGPWWRDTLLIVLLAYLAKFWALAHRTVAGSIAAGDGDAVRAARASGASGWVTLRRILLPMLRPAILSAWLLVFLFGIHELTMSSLLYGPGTATLAVVTLEVQQLGDPTVTAALAVLLTVPGVAAAVLTARHRGAK